MVDQRDVPVTTMTALVLAVFTVSVGYGVVLPLLPDLVARLLPGGATSSQIARHTGLLTSAYALALFVAAPAWGRLSDVHGRRNLLVIALLGFSVVTLAFSLAGSLTAIYIQRFLSGLCAAAITPIASATIADLVSANERRGRRLTSVSMAGIAGFMLGPALGVFAMRMGAQLFAVVAPTGSVAIPLATTAVFTALVSVPVALTVPHARAVTPSAHVSVQPIAGARSLIGLLALTFVVSAAIGVFEVGLTLRGTQELGLTPYQIALMFTECSLVMLIVQAIVFSPQVRANHTRRLIPPGLFVLAVSLVLVTRATDFWRMLTVTGVVAASAGVVAPILTYWTSAEAGPAQGWELGRQTAAASLGVTAGSAAGGLLFNVGVLPGPSFVFAAVLVAAGSFLSIGLSRRLGLG